jgi:hypothetical protein
MHVLRAYMYTVTLPVLRREYEALGKNARALLPHVRRWLTRQPQQLDESDRLKLRELASSRSYGKARIRATRGCSRISVSGAGVPRKAATSISRTS